MQTLTKVYTELCNQMTTKNAETINLYNCYCKKMNLEDVLLRKNMEIFHLNLEIT